MHSDCFSILDSSDPFAAFWPQGSEDEYPFGNLMLHANCLVTSHMKLFGRISKLKSPLRCFVSDKFGSATFLSNIPHSSSVALRLSSSMAFCTSASSRLASESLLGNEKSQCRLFWVKYIYIDLINPTCQVIVGGVEVHSILWDSIHGKSPNHVLTSRPSWCLFGPNIRLCS